MIGELTAIVATLSTPIKGDVFAPGLIRDLRLVFLSHWGHSYLEGHPPVGMGEVREVGNRIVFTGRFDQMHTAEARSAYERVRRLGPRCRWSIALEPLEWDENGAITHCRPIEVSPALIAADPSTYTARCGDYRCPAEFLQIASLRAVTRQVGAAATRKDAPRRSTSRSAELLGVAHD